MKYITSLLKRTKKLHFGVLFPAKGKDVGISFLIFYFLPKAKIFWYLIFLFNYLLIFWFSLQSSWNSEFWFSIFLLNHSMKFQFGFWLCFLFNRHSSMKYKTSLLLLKSHQTLTSYPFQSRTQLWHLILFNHQFQYGKWLFSSSLDYFVLMSNWKPLQQSHSFLGIHLI